MLKTGVLLGGLTALLLTAGYMLGGEGGLMIALGFAAVSNLFAYWNADKLVLRLYNAQPADKLAPDLVAMVNRLADGAGLPRPKTYVIDDPQPNAFATGRSPERAAVAATTGLLRSLTAEEIAGVMAHELAHVQNRDTLIMTVTATVASALSFVANFAFFLGGHHRNNPLGMIGTLALAIIAPLAAMLVQMAISRSREYEADRAGAEICGNPQWLASALAKLEQHAKRVPNMRAEENPATAHLFIVNPLHAHSIDGLFSTHPPMAERIRRLQAMTGANRPKRRGSRGSVPSTSVA